jgi:hypothetical protein
MTKILAMDCTKKLNFFPPKGGISNYYSPRTILHQETLDFNKYCSVPFGAYVQAHNEPNFKNSQQPRAIDCIYLRYIDNIQGGHHLLDLNTGYTIKRRSITQVPITNNIIGLVHKLADADGIKEGLKITNKSNVILYDSSWIAGMDYVDEEYDDEYSEERNNEIKQLENDEMNPNEISEMTCHKQNNNDDDSDADNNNDKELFERESNPEELEPEESEPEKLESETELESEEVDEVTRTKSGRIIKPPSKLNLHQCHLQTQSYERTEYSIETGKFIAKHIIEFNNKCNYQFVETYGLKKGLKRFGNDDYNAAMKEMQQLHERVAFKPINVGKLTQQEKQ